MEVLVDLRNRRQWDVLVSQELKEWRLFPPDTEKDLLVTTKMGWLGPIMLTTVFRASNSCF